MGAFQNVFGSAEDSSVDVDALAAAVVAGMTGVRLTVQQQAGLKNGKTLCIVQGDDYSVDPVTITIDQSGMTNPSADLRGFHLVVSFRQGAGVKGFRMPILGTPGNHTASFNAPASQTETLETGRHDALFRIEYGPNAFKTVNPGFVQVDAADVEPGDIVDI
tara:strand:+ start:978 stop:1463 length:486 start_codon:yes stop_codon:yes gene_type:complete